MTTDVDTPPESWINDRKADWLAELSPEDYSRAMALLEEVLGIPYRYSPEATAAALLRSLHARPGGKRLEVAEMPPPAFEPTTERDLRWIRPLTGEEQGAPFIVAYDVNAAYLAACSALPLGVGELIHFGGDCGPLWAQHPGYFLVNGSWVTNVTQAAFPWPVSDAYVWSGHTRPLEPWYKVLRDARDACQVLNLRGLGGPQLWVTAALQTIKMMYCGFFGRCASTKWNRTGDPLFRPDWRHMVIATRRTRLQRVMAQCDPAPFAAYSDCLYFAPAQGQTVTGLRIGSNPGSFKLHGCVRNVDPVYSSIMAGDLNAVLELVKE